MLQWFCLNFPRNGNVTLAAGWQHWRLFEIAASSDLSASLNICAAEMCESARNQFLCLLPNNRLF